MTRFSRIRRMLLAASVAIPLLAAACGESSITSAATTSAPPVFFSSQGKCARWWKDGEPSICRESKFGNAFLPTFTPRTGEWGIAYAYNCGKKKGTFAFTIDLTSWDQNASTTNFATRGKRGHGYYMETGKDTVSIKAANAAGGWGDLENVVVQSTCRFAVAGVDGNASVVSQYVPPIPKKS